MDELYEFLNASSGEEYFAGSTQDCFDKLNSINPKHLPMWEKWYHRKPGEEGVSDFTKDYEGYFDEWFSLGFTIKLNGGNFGITERFKLNRLIQQFESIGTYWSGG